MGAIGSDASLRGGTAQLGAGALAVYALAQLGRREEVEGLIEDFTPKTARTFEVARSERFAKGSGMPISIPVIEMIEIGAGGGNG